MQAVIVQRGPQRAFRRRGRREVIDEDVPVGGRVLANPAGGRLEARARIVVAPGPIELQRLGLRVRGINQRAILEEKVEEALRSVEARLREGTA